MLLALFSSIYTQCSLGLETVSVVTDNHITSKIQINYLHVKPCLSPYPPPPPSPSMMCIPSLLCCSHQFISDFSSALDCISIIFILLTFGIEKSTKGQYDRASFFFFFNVTCFCQVLLGNSVIYFMVNTVFKRRFIHSLSSGLSLPQRKPE